MIKQGIKNYFVSLKYVFTILGALALGVVLGLSILIPGVISAVKTLVDDTIRIVSSVELDADALLDRLWDAVYVLDWSDPMGSVRTIFSEKWMTDTLYGCVDGLVGGANAFEQQLMSSVTKCLDAVLFRVVVFAVCAIIGLIGGYYFTKWLVRRGIAKRKLRMFFLVTLLDALFSVALIIIAAWLAVIWWKSVFISAIIMLVLECLVTLYEAYFVHGRKKVDPKRIVNMKNVIKLVIANAIVLLISIAITFMAVLINRLAGLFIGASFIAMAIIVTGMNAEAYVKSLAAECEQNVQTEESTESVNAA